MYDTKPPVLHLVYSEKLFRCKTNKTFNIVLIKSSLSTLKAGQLESVVCLAGPHREHGTVVENTFQQDKLKISLRIILVRKWMTCIID